MVATELTDAELLDRARDGDEAAFTALYVRHHAVIRRLAASYRRHEPDDLVDATFGQVVAQLRRRSGPTEAFRTHLFATVHARVVDQPELTRLPQVEAVPPPVAAVAAGPALGGADRVMITRAFESLPGHWQVPVWHTVVVGSDPAAVAHALDAPTEAGGPLARYAGHKLRQGFLQAHLDTSPRPGCEPHRRRLTAHLRGALGADADDGVRDHLERCVSCRDLVASLDRLDELLARSVVPLFPTPAGRAGVPMPLGAPGSAAIEVTGVAQTDDDPPDGDGEADDDLLGGDRWARARALAPAVGSAAAATALVAGLAVLGTAMTRDDAEQATDAAATDADPPAPDGADPANLGGDDDGGRDREGSDPDGEGTGAGADGTSTTTDADDEAGPPATAGTENQGDEPTGPSSGRVVPAAASREPTTTEPQPEPPAGRPAPTSPPTTAVPPTTQPAPDPVLASWQLSWSATAPDAGTLRVVVSMPDGPGEPETRPVAATVALSAGARSAGGLDDRCQAASGGRQVTCTIPAPTPGQSATVALDLTIEARAQSATVSARQAGTSLGAHTIDLAVPPAPTSATPETGS